MKTKTTVLPVVQPTLRDLVVEDEALRSDYKLALLRELDAYSNLHNAARKFFTRRKIMGHDVACSCAACGFARALNDINTIKTI